MQGGMKQTYLTTSTVFKPTHIIHLSLIGPQIHITSNAIAIHDVLLPDFRVQQVRRTLL